MHFVNRYDQIMADLDAGYGFRKGAEWVHLSEVELAQVERELGYELPPDYREFLRDYGNAVPIGGACFTLEENIDGLRQGRVGIFYGAGNRIRGYDIVEENEGGAPTCGEPLRIKDCASALLIMDIQPGLIEVEWPSYFLKFGEDGGTIVYLVLDGPRKNWVIYGENDGCVGVQKFYIAARSFEEFMNSLRPCEDEDDQFESF